MKILVTGGAGYIGSVTCSALEEAGHQPVILDSLVTGCPDFVAGRPFYQADIAQKEVLEQVLREHPDTELTIHFAARIQVPESVSQPALYYRENVLKSLQLFENLAELGQKKVIFSSSASIYESPVGENLSVSETSSLKPLSPYAKSKWMTEEMLKDLCAASDLRGLALRYFNPVGADPRLRSGPYLPDPSHLLGRLLTAVRTGETFLVTGTDYPTRDGTGLRDFIHIWDLALAHVAAAERFDSAFAQAAQESGEPQSYLAVNVGSGEGVTVREFVQAFEQVYPGELQAADGPRRPGDSAGAYADITRARRWLGWSPSLSIREAVESALAWQARA
ncbi:UDP-glucose 4-epimerase GalE [Deinococcus lacus]|uniref:UDP-glucose 4-epimerase n=1 Tax=Deinococcus lacus TaxID=392561 RepID=A0ABW1YE50_9DEIO